MPTHFALRSGHRVGSALLGIVVAITVLALATPVAAQVAQGRGRLTGQVFDEQGDPVAGATVTLTYVSTGVTYDVTTKDDGRWLKGNMGRGAWNIDINAPGFLPARQSANVQEYTQNLPVETILVAGDANAPAGPVGAAALFTGALGDKMKAANVLYDAQDYVGAQAAFEAILAEEMAKDNPLEHLYLVSINAGNAAFEAREYEAATKHFQDAATAAPDNVQGPLGLAKVAMMQRDLDGALAYLAQIDVSDIRDPIVFYNIGSLLFAQGQSAEAQKYYEFAVQRNPGFADAHMQLGLCLIQQGQIDAAKSSFEKVIELDPGSQNAAVAQDFLNSIG